MSNITINAAPGCSKLAERLEKMVYGKSGVAARALSGCTFDLGPATDARFGVPSHAVDPLFVGDAAWIEGRDVDAATEAMFAAHPENVSIRPVYNPATQKWRLKFSIRQGGDALDPIAGQLFSPWNISYMAQIFKEPLAYSNVDRIVSYFAGSNPWAEIFTLAMEQYAGWAMAGETGSLQNTMISDVNVKDGLMSANIINLSGTYSLTLEEQVRGNGGSPWGESPMVRKQQYLNYAMNMMKAIIAYFGNEETLTDGFAQVNGIVAHPAGQDIKTLSQGTQPGYQIYRMLADIINERIVVSDGKLQSFKFVMSPEALAILKSTPYSEVYDPTSAMRIFMKNYGATTKDGGVPEIEFISEPLLKANSELNPSTADLSLLVCPKIGAGPSDTLQDTYIYAAPLQRFVFPAIPGQYNTQFKTLSRLAGIMAPIPGAIKMYQGLGVQN